MTLELFIIKNKIDKRFCFFSWSGNTERNENCVPSRHFIRFILLLHGIFLSNYVRILICSGWQATVNFKTNLMYSEEFMSSVWSFAFIVDNISLSCFCTDFLESTVKQRADVVTLPNDSSKTRVCAWQRQQTLKDGDSSAFADGNHKRKTKSNPSAAF